MMRRWISLMVCLSVLVMPVVGMASGQPAATGGLALVRLVTADEEGVAAAEASGATLFARLGGQSFLAGADAEQRQSLASAGVTVTVVDPVLQAGGYYLAYPMPGTARPDLALYGEVLWVEREMAVLHASAEGAAALAGTGVKVVAVTLDPKPWQPHAAAQSFPTVVDLDPVIHMMVDQVTLTDVYSYTGGLSGEWPVEIGGSPYTIATRYTYSGTPIQKATQYVGEWLGDLGLDVEYHQWSGPTYPNVIAELPGSVNPDQIYIIGGHLDDVPSSGPAPGADDNASGSVATLLAAEILTQFEWGCTLRFAFWTGEEQGLHGSAAYAQRAYNLGEDIQGYLNLDMIAWNTPNSSPDINLYAEPSIPPTLDLAQLFADVVEAYNLDLIPEIIPSGFGASDHASFWNYGYTAILGIEDYPYDFNPYYHTSNDLLQHLDMDYYTDFVKASIGTFAHMTGCLIPGGIGTLSGTVTAADGGAPIEGATVVVEDDQGHEYPTTTGASGIYSRMFLADAYTATVSVYGYVPAVVPGIMVVTDTVTVQDFALEAAPTYLVAGTVVEAGSGFPLAAEIQFLGSPVTVMTDPADGSYEASLPEGEYTMRVSAAGHRPEEREIVADQDQVQDFALQPLPCILVVDDDNNAPDVRPYYTAALNALGYDYDVFDVGGGGGDGPSADELAGYQIVVWFSGDKYGSSAGPNGTDEANLADYLDGGGRLFLSSQDYLYDFGLTPFGQNYLGVGSFTNDGGNATTKYGVAGDPIGDGLGPYSLSYPTGFSDYGDVVNAGAGASVAFRSASVGGNNLDVDKDGGDWRTVFFGTSWVPIYHYNAVNGVEVLGRIVEWFGGCEADPVIWVEPPALAATLEPGGVVTHTLWITNAGGAELTFTLHEVTGTVGMAAGGQLEPAAWEPAWAGASEFELTLEVEGAVADGGEARVIIALREEPDLSGAYEIEDWAGRGQYVYDALQAHWEREGAGLESWLAAAGADPQALPAANAIAATVDEALLRALAGRPEVARVELDRPVALSDTFLGEGGGEPQGVEWNIAKIRADEVWSELGVTGEGVSVGNVGTGVMYTHEALVAQYRGNLGGGLFDHNYHWYDFVNGQPAPYDDNGHSTFGTGVVVGDDGGSNQIGVAPGAEWMAAKACNAYGSCSQADLLAAMAWMLAPTDLNGDNPDPSRAPQVVFNMWGGGTCDTFFQAILDAWQAAGIVPVFAIGGNGPGCMTIASPADLPESFTAGATDANDVIAPFSSRGPSCWDEIKPETAAPGVEIRSSINNGGYSIWSGTSFSAAHLAGTVALVLSADPRLGQEELETVIKETALCIEDLLCGGTPCPDGANNVYGWGRIDAFEAVSMTLGTGGEDLLPWLSEVPMAGALAPGEGMAIAVRFDATGLEPRVYVGLLDVESNDPLTPHVSVPVTMTVEPSCDPLADVGLSWEPPTPTAGEVVTLTAEARGTEPIAFEWDLGDGTVAAGAVVTHTYGVSGTYTVVLTATNPCSQEVVVEPITVVAEGVALRIYLPIMLRK